MKRKIFVKENYSLCLRYLREIKWHIVLSLGIFSFIFILGFLFPILFREEILSLISELMFLVEGKNLYEMIIFIFLNNLKVSFIAMISGIFIGLFPLITLIVNGYVLGFVARESVELQGLSILWRLLPHGIFELPAVFFSTGIGLKIGLDLFKKDWKKKIKHNFNEGLRFFISVVIPFLIIAALIESALIFYFS
ncbi:MAG: stage II sporulation protein M [Candidatus Pacearchaeota archaeon]